MTCKLLVRSSLILLLATVLSATLSAQRVEIYPNAGFIWPHHMDNGQNFRDQAIWGVKGGVFFGENMQVEGSYEYLNHFQLREPPNPFNPVFGIVPPAVRGHLYDANFVYSFRERKLYKERTLIPFVSAGGGGLTAYIPDASFVFIQGGGTVINAGGAVAPNPAPSKIMDSGATFFTVNYGGGVKFPRSVGPMGFRVDVRGRTIPNFFGQRTTWVEPTAGVTFSWGER